MWRSWWQDISSSFCWISSSLSIKLLEDFTFKPPVCRRCKIFSCSNMTADVCWTLWIVEGSFSKFSVAHNIAWDSSSKSYNWSQFADSLSWQSTGVCLVSHVAMTLKKVLVPVSTISLIPVRLEFFYGIIGKSGRVIAWNYTIALLNFIMEEHVFIFFGHSDRFCWCHRQV